MVVKTYAIHGLSEWHGDVKAGSISVRVSFTGGTASPSGALPAYFVTKDPVTQFIIENSNEYKKGFIRLDMQQLIAGEHPRMGVHKKSAEIPATAVEPESVPVEDPAADNDGVQKVSVADKNDAIEWLKEHNPEAGYTASKLRSKEVFEAACKECNVEFIY